MVKLGENEKKDLLQAKRELNGHAICLCKNGICRYGNEKGIASIMKFIDSGEDFEGYVAADCVVGKAAAMMFVKCGIVAVYAKTLSENGRRIFEKYKIYYEYDEIAEYIINRSGTDMCPMEKVVLNTENVEEAFLLLKNKSAELSKH